jgi:uncharacterized membrane protein YraQ (UPF0718 family)
MQLLIALTFIATIVSFFVDRDRTIEGAKRGLTMFINLLPNWILVLILISSFLYFVPETTIIKILGAQSGLRGLLIAAVAGSIAMIPPFVLFPIANILLGKGVSYSVVAVFITNLMMVGVLTAPIELKYFGVKATLARNILSFFGAIAIGIFIGMFMK